MVKRDVKCSRSTAELRRELVILSEFDVGGIRGVAVKCLDITKNPDCEGSAPWTLLTLKLEGAGIEQD